MWFEEDYRRIFMDMHLNDTNEEYLSKLDVDDFVANLTDANVTSVVVKCKSHVGLHYWSSKYGKQHATLKSRNLDYVGDMIRTCHENDINVILYFSQIFDNYAYKHHASWRITTPVLPIGSMVSFGKSKERYGLVCPNNPHYREYCKEILTELAETYSFEGIFMDMPFWPRMCYCKHCRKKYRKETGRIHMPWIYNFSSQAWVELIEARQRWINEFMALNTKTLKDINPNIAVEHNMAAVGNNWFNGNVESQFQCSDYASGDYYGGYLQQTFMCKYYNNMTVHKPFSYITSRCDSNLYSHTVSRTYEDLAIHCLNALVHNGAFSICDAMNPDGTITEKVYKNEIKKLFNTTPNLEQYVSGVIKSDVAIWYNTAYKTNENFITSSFNITQVLLENNIAFDVIGAKNIATTKAQVICMADMQKITDDEVELLESYVNRGGSLFITGALGGNKKLEDLVGVKINGTSDYGYTYLTPCKTEYIFENFDTSSPYPVQHTALLAEVVAADMEVLAKLSFPYTKRSDKDFSAIHSDPPGIHTDMPAIVKRVIGDGNIIWCVNPLELTVAHNCRKTICRLISSMIKTREFESNAPAFVEIVKWTKNDKTYLSLVNQQAVCPVYPITDIEITLDKLYDDIKLVSDTNGELVIYERDGKSLITVKSLEIFHMIQLI